MFRSLALAAAVFSLAAGAAAAQGRSPDVSAAIGVVLKARSAEIGARDVEDLRQDLIRTVSEALERSHGGALHAARVEMIIEDVRSNRPTFARLGREPGLSMQSLSLGGAKISGRVIDDAGEAHPFQISFYENDLRNDVGAATWTDAARAFDLVARDIVSGRLDRN